MDVISLIISVITFFISIMIFVIVRRPRKDRSARELDAMERRITDNQSRSQKTVNQALHTQIQHLSEYAQQTDQRLDNISRTMDRRLQSIQDDFVKQIDKLRMVVDDKLTQTQETIVQGQSRTSSMQIEQAKLQSNQIKDFSQQVEQKLENIRTVTDRRLEGIREENSKQLDQMRMTVDEKLQKTLEERIGQSFKLVSERLEQVYKGLGEMQTLANGVGDLKRVLSGVKSRGVLGEIQLGAILEQVLSPEQYASCVSTRPNSRQQVEFAVKMPGVGEENVWLPIDSKFPYDRYHDLCDAYDSGDKSAVEIAAKELVAAVKKSAKDIRDKYVEPPYTTEFAILFLPFEGLYAELVRRGMVETLQKEYRINITGPTTMGAFLNSLQIGFRTLAIQKRSGEVWNLLGQVKSEFLKFSEVLEKTQDKLRLAGNELEKLVGTRTRSIIRSLKEVETIPESGAEEVKLRLTDS